MRAHKLCGCVVTCVGDTEHEPRVTYCPLHASVGDLLAALEAASEKMFALGREFTGPRFTDRYGDGPELLNLAEIADRAIRKAKGE